MHNHQIMLTTGKNLRVQPFYEEADADRLVREARRNQVVRRRFSLPGIRQCFKLEKSLDQEQIPNINQPQTTIEPGK